MAYYHPLDYTDGVPNPKKIARRQRAEEAERLLLWPQQPYNQGHQYNPFLFGPAFVSHREIFDDAMARPKMNYPEPEENFDIPPFEDSTSFDLNDNENDQNLEYETLLRRLYHLQHSNINFKSFKSAFDKMGESKYYSHALEEESLINFKIRLAREQIETMARYF